MTEIASPAPPAPAPAASPRLSGLREVWFYFSHSRGAVVGLAVFVALVAVALLAPWIAPHDPIFQYRDAFLTPPVWQEGGDPRFLLGTDAIGRDILSRLMHGARYSLLIGAVVVTIALTGGILLGLLAGYFRGWVDTLIMRVMDIILAFPSLLLALVMVTVIGPGLFNAMLAIALVLQPHFARLTRAAVISETNREYVTSAKLAGAGHLRLMFSTILPNCLAPLIVQATLSFSSAILDAAALGFLGLGAQPPIPEWGTMLADSREFITRAWWVITIPGIAILITVLAINLIGDGLRDALDPKLKRS
jgi:dipeptide transport system permease protein